MVKYMDDFRELKVMKFKNISCLWLSLFRSIFQSNNDIYLKTFHVYG